jgi:hypothetical protein
MKHYCLALLSFLPVCAAHSQRELKELIPELVQKVEEVISDDWFVEPAKDGFDVYFCRSCNERYEEWVKSGDELRGVQRWRRAEFFRSGLADSVSFYGTVSRPMIDPKDSVARERIDKQWYEKNGILKFSVRLGKSWDEEDVKEVQQKNDQMKEAILSEPIYKTSMHIFDDYRFWVPEIEWQWKERTKQYDFAFERLPYASCWYDYAIFIEQDKPFFFSEVLYADAADPRYYNNSENFIEDERTATLKIIALVLGIPDFKPIN